MPGHFISFEGGEGTGKSTQIKMLANWLIEKQQDVLITREPGGTEGAEAIRTLLLNGDNDRWNMRSETLLFAAARADHVAKLINPALAEGKWVLTDRFIDSSRAYQSAAGGLDDCDIMQLHDFGSAGLLPDITFLLTLPIDKAHARLKNRDGDNGDRIQDRAAAFHRKVLAGFQSYAEQDPDRFCVIDGDADIATVHSSILSNMSRLGW